MVLCLLLQMLLTKLATMITIMINERMMRRIVIMIIVMQKGVVERTVAGHVRSLLLHGKWQGNSAECPFSYQGPWSTSKQCSLSQTNDHRSACFAANAQSRVYLCVRSWNQSSRKCKSPCMNCTIGMLPPPSPVAAQSKGNGSGER